MRLEGRMKFLTISLIVIFTLLVFVSYSEKAFQSIPISGFSFKQNSNLTVKIGQNDRYQKGIIETDISVNNVLNLTNTSLPSFNVTLIISAAGLIMNLREEVTYFTDYDVGIMLPVALSLMIIPSILINIFPFIIFLSAMWTLIKLKNSGEILSLKTFGLSSTKFVYLLGITSFLVGIIILIAINPIT